jgi:cell division inhibitor SepF
MGFMDNLRKLTQPYGEEDDFFEGADSSFAPQESEPVGDAQMEFESSFAEEPASAPEPATKRSAKPPRSGGLFSRSSEPRSSSRPAKTGRGRQVSSDQSVVRFNPRSFDEAGELVSFLEQGRSLIMSLEEIPSETARRLLDFMSGIAFALNGKITPVSAKTYFITPENVDLLDAQSPSGNPSDQE